MKLSGTTGTVLMLLALASVGAGTYFFKTVQVNRKLELQARTKEAQQKAKEAEQKTREAEARTAEAEAKEKEAERKIKRDEADKAAAELETKKQETENLKAQKEADTAAAAKAEAEALSAAAAMKKAEAEKAAADAAKAEAEQKAALETLALKRAEAERARAEAEKAKTEAAKTIAEAALEKSENELKTAQANAEAERDRKLRMYRRAETSRAEMLALQRAERLLALDESGALTAADLEAGASAGGAAATTAPAEEKAGEKTNAVVKVDWPETSNGQTPGDLKVGEIGQKMVEKANAETRRRARAYIKSFGDLADAAAEQGRVADAAHYRQTLTALVPDYVEVYSELIDEARKGKDQTKEETHLVKSLLATVPNWQRVATCEKLLLRDEAYFSKMLAGQVGRDEYVKAFRKLYDQAMRDKGDHDERREKMAHLCQVLSTYVPDFEHSPEWK